MTDTRTDYTSRVCQGDILRNIPYIEHVIENEGVIEVSSVVFPYVVVLTQDCDLEQDHNSREEGRDNQDKWLISVLVAPLYNAEHVYDGEHLSELSIKSQQINKKRSPGQIIRQNSNPRYHYLEFPEEIPVVPSIIDFKHYFSVNTEYLRELKSHGYVCTVSELYREDISQRFSAFLSRIGLPA